MPVCVSWPDSFRYSTSHFRGTSRQYSWTTLISNLHQRSPRQAVTIKSSAFADDAKCFLPISSRADCLSLQHDLSLLANWSSSWKLTFNENKCSVVHFTRGQSSAILSYSVNNTIISTAGSQKDLGVIMSSDMQWRSHYLFIIPRAYKMLWLIRRVFSSSTDVYAKRCLYLSLVRSKLLYCSPVWRPQYLVDIRSLETVQRRASKFIISNYSMNYRDRLISLEMLPL